MHTNNSIIKFIRCIAIGFVLVLSSCTDSEPDGKNAAIEQAQNDKIESTTSIADPRGPEQTKASSETLDIEEDKAIEPPLSNNLVKEDPIIKAVDTTLVSSNSKIVSLKSLEINNVETSDRKISISFKMKSSKCYGINSTITETQTSIILEIQTGALSGVNISNCNDQVYDYKTEVTLNDPVGKRIIKLNDTEADANEAIIVQDLVGQDIDDAIDIILDNGLKWQVSNLDGETRTTVKDDSKMVTLEVSESIVTKAE